MEYTYRVVDDTYYKGTVKDQSQNAAAKEQIEEQKRAFEDYKKGILKACLEPEAYERLCRVALVKPENTHMAEQYLLNLCQRNRTHAKIDEATVRAVLEKVNQTSDCSMSKQSIQFRRKNCLDSDDDF